MQSCSIGTAGRLLPGVAELAAAALTRILLPPDPPGEMHAFRRYQETRVILSPQEGGWQSAFLTHTARRSRSCPHKKTPMELGPATVRRPLGSNAWESSRWSPADCPSSGCLAVHQTTRRSALTPPQSVAATIQFQLRSSNFRNQTRTSSRGENGHSFRRTNLHAAIVELGLNLGFVASHREDRIDHRLGSQSDRATAGRIGS